MFLDKNFNCSDSLENISNNVGFGSVACSNLDLSGFEQLIDIIFDMTLWDLYVVYISNSWLLGDGVDNNKIMPDYLTPNQNHDQIMSKQN